MKKVRLLAIAGFALYPMVVYALGMSSTNYVIEWDSINSGGEDTSSSTNYNLRDTLGQFVSGDGASESYKLRAGYRVGDQNEPSLSFEIGTQENSTQVSWTAFSDVGNNVTVSTASNFSEDDFVGVVEDKGFSQLIAVGRITDVSGSIITVDNWEGEPGSISATPSGGNDYVYRLNGSTAQFGTMDPDTEGTSLTVTNVVTNAENGYTVSVQASSTFSNGASSILDVSDGTVTVANEEYGGESVGTSATSTGSDFPFTTSKTNIQEASSAGSNDRVGVIYKLSTTAITPSGNYEQTLIYRLTGNF